ncbi:MAG TPA: hypothetical protein VF556_02715 [Pyrinomonadaceae bacterium]|jgi:hypothetical protein
MKLLFNVILILIFATTTFGQQTERDKAIDLFRQENFNAAAKILTNVTSADKTDHEAWLYLGMSLAKIGETKTVMEAFIKAIDIKPRKPLSDGEGFKITAQPRADFPNANFGGFVILAVEFRADGKIGMIIPVRATRGGFAESGVTAAKKIKFKPMIKDGKPVTIIRIVQYSFTV